MVWRIKQLQSRQLRYRIVVYSSYRVVLDIAVAYVALTVTAQCRHQNQLFAKHGAVECTKQVIFEHVTEIRIEEYGVFVMHVGVVWCYGIDRHFK